MNFDVEVVRTASAGEETLTVFADGGCHSRGDHKGVGAWAYVVLRDLNAGRPLSGDSGVLRDSTNNRAELLGVLNAFKTLLVAGSVVRLKVYSDSRYVVDIWNKYLWRWQGSFVGLANQDLLQTLWDYHRGFAARVTVAWVRGHSGNVWNELVDSMCTREIEQITGRRKCNTKS